MRFRTSTTHRPALRALALAAALAAAASGPAAAGDEAVAQARIGAHDGIGAHPDEGVAGADMAAEFFAADEAAQAVAQVLHAVVVDAAHLRQRGSGVVETGGGGEWRCEHDGLCQRDTPRLGGQPVVVLSGLAKRFRSPV